MKEKTVQKILLNAIDHEKNSRIMYEKAAAESGTPSTSKLFLFLAEEEEKHVMMLQDEYDKVFQQDN